MYVKANNKSYPVTELLVLSDEQYTAYRDKMQKGVAERKSEPKIDGEELFLLTVGEGYDDGILVDFTGSGYESVHAFISDARRQINDHIRRLADYCISEGTEHTENGLWQISYEELYYHFDKTNINNRNVTGSLLEEELKKRDEINELIMTEDCIEIAYHMEYCECCQQGGIKGAMNLLSLMGCNLYDVHLEHESPGFAFQDVSKLNQNTLTEEGKAEWSDVLGAEVESIRPQADKLCVCLSNCDPFRVLAFTEMMNGQCDAEDYDQWVQNQSEQEQEEESGPAFSM